MKYLYLCRAVPMKVCDHLRDPVAGNKFSLHMAQAIDTAVSGKLELISLRYIHDALLNQLDAHEIWTGKKFRCIPIGKRFLISEIQQAYRLFRYIRKLRKECPSEEITLIVENSPMGAAACCTALKRFCKMPVYSITIDTPFTATLSKKGLVGRLNHWKFAFGHKQLKHFNGIITFSEEVCKQLRISIPFCEFAVGCDPADLPPAEFRPKCTTPPIKKIVYAGTFIYYNGIPQMLDAFAELGAEYELHLYGYGPLESLVKEMAEKHANIVYHGRFDPKNTKEILQSADLLLNPRVLDPYIENFTFPSKLIDYILAGKNVLSSKFKTLPPPYNDFLYLMDTVTAENIISGVRAVFSDSPDTREAKIHAGIRYIREHQTYDIIAEKLVDFMLNENQGK